MYESKPLALLMLDMYDESALWKEAILADSFDIEIPVDFYGIYSVEATDRAVRNDVFMAQADAYLKAVKDLVEMSKEKQQVKKFNSTIDACVSCHQVFCQGPIDKIKHLYIEE
jgi:cytochrome c553